MYCQRLDPASTRHPLWLLRLATHYKHAALEYVMIDYLNQAVTPMTVCSYLIQAKAVKDQSLLGNCLDIIANQADVVFGSSSFLVLSRDLLEEIVQQPGVNASEMEIFRASVSWAKTECKRQGLRETSVHLRQVLGHVLEHIQFQFMSRGDVNEVLESEVLEANREEIIAIMKLWFPV